MLNAAIAQDITDNNTKTIYARSCKYLEKELNSIYADMVAHLGYLDSNLKKLDANATVAANVVNSISKNAAMCVAAAAKVKTKPTKAIFVQELFTPARNLSQALGNIAGLRAKGHQIPAKYDDMQAKAFYNLIRPYGTDDVKKRMKDDADANTVLNELKVFTHLVKQVAEYAKP